MGKSTRPFEPVVDEVVHRLHEQRLPDAPVLVRYADDALGVWRVVLLTNSTDMATRYA